LFAVSFFSPRQLVELADAAFASLLHFPVKISKGEFSVISFPGNLFSCSLKNNTKKQNKKKKKQPLLPDH